MSQGSPFRVNTITSGIQTGSTIGLDADGDFVVAWNSGTPNTSPIRAQRYNAAGMPQGSEFPIGTTTPRQQVPKIAMDDDGDFVVASVVGGFNSYDIYAQRYSAAGLLQGSVFQVNTTITNNQHRHNVAIDADGDFVVTWQSNYQLPGGLPGTLDYGIYARRYAGAVKPTSLIFPLKQTPNLRRDRYRYGCQPHQRHRHRRGQ